jgi:hypothetical protein
VNSWGIELRAGRLVAAVTLWRDGGVFMVRSDEEIARQRKADLENAGKAAEQLERRIGEFQGGLETFARSVFAKIGTHVDQKNAGFLVEEDKITKDDGPATARYVRMCASAALDITIIPDGNSPTGVLTVEITGLKANGDEATEPDMEYVIYRTGSYMLRRHGREISVNAAVAEIWSKFWHYASQKL